MMAGLLWYRSYMDSLANTSGYYPDIHAGHADRVAKLTLDAPYLVRDTPAGYNQLELSSIIGGTVAWNQLCDSSSVTGTSGHKFYLKKSGVESITNTNTFTGLASGTDMVTDLTLMLGSAIADYVYSLEQATAGRGIAWLKSYDLIDDQYHAYSAPTLQSVEATSHIAKDGNGNVISTTTFGTTTLRGMLKTDADGNLYYDGDTYEWDGTVTRKYAELTITGDDLNLAQNIQKEGNLWRLSLASAGLPSKTAYEVCVCPPYTPASSYAGVNNTNMSVGLNQVPMTQVLLRNDAFATRQNIIDGLNANPLTIVYELATQTTESADPFTAVQTVEDGGTEEFITGNNVPVGNVSVYRRA